MAKKSGYKLVKGPMPGRVSTIVEFPIGRGADGRQLKSKPEVPGLPKSPPRGDAGEKPETGEYFGTP